MSRQPQPWFWKARQEWYVKIEGKRYRLGSDQVRALQLYHQIMAQPRPERYLPTDSVAAILDAFLTWTKRHRAPRTYDCYVERLQSFVDAIPARLRADDLKPYHVQSWVDAKKRWSDGHKRGCITAVQRAFNWAVKMGYLDKNPIAGIEKPRAGRREVVITPEEFKRLLTLGNDDDFKDLVTFCWHTGCRPQEATNLESRHLDLANHRAIYPPEEAKIKTRPRIVYFNETAEEIVTRRAARYPKGSLFRNAKGAKWHKNNISCRFQRLRKHFGKKFCLYNFRHSFANRLLVAGIDALTVATLLGHADTTMLSRCYSHIRAEHGYLLESLKSAS